MLSAGRSVAHRQRRRDAGRQRSGRATRARGARRGAPGRPDPRRERGDRRLLGRGPSRRTVRLSGLPADGREGATRAAGGGRAPCRSRSSSTRRRIVCARPSAISAEALGGDRTLVVAREITKKFETIARMTLAEASRMVRCRSESRARRVRAARRRAASDRGRGRRPGAATRAAARRARRRAAAGARRARRRGGDRVCRAKRSTRRRSR